MRLEDLELPGGMRTTVASKKGFLTERRAICEMMSFRSAAAVA